MKNVKLLYVITQAPADCVKLAVGAHNRHSICFPPAIGRLCEASKGNCGVLACAEGGLTTVMKGLMANGYATAGWLSAEKGI